MQVRLNFAGSGGGSAGHSRRCRFVGGHGTPRCREGILVVGSSGGRRDVVGRLFLSPWQAVVCVSRFTVVGRVDSITTVTVALPPERKRQGEPDETAVD